MIDYTKQLERASGVLTGNPSPNTRARLQAKAERISRAGDLKAHLAVIESALMKAINILYESDTDGHPANYDYNGQVLIALPFTYSGWKLYGLRNWEADCLRRVMLERLKRTEGYIPLFDYAPATRRWYLRIDAYKTEAHALQWLKVDPVTVTEWRAALQRFYTQRAKYKTK
jgi:hypothetical protein